MSRRLTTFVLTVFYLMQGTWLLHAGMDLILPTVRQAAVAAAPDSCCDKACGCPEDVKAVYGCCCSKGKATPAPEQHHGKTSFFEAARCKGVEDAMTQAFTQPVVCAFAALPPAQADATLFSAPDAKPFIPPTILVLDKVPIA
jgi:hypothetical protein